MNIIVHRLTSVSSTNDAALRMAADDVPEGTVVVAREQTSGRGRLGRAWASPPGDGLYLSIILRPSIAFDCVWQIAFVAAVAAAKAVRRVSGLIPGIKWPNDLLLNGRKVGGILVEARPDAEALVVVVGIGLNVGNTAFPPEIAETATSITLESGRPVSVEQAEDVLVASFEKVYSAYLREGFGLLLAEWREFDCTAGRQVSVVSGGADVKGTAEGVDDSGSLLVRTVDGVVSVSAGEVVMRE